MANISVVVPVLNEEGNLKLLIYRLLDVLKKHTDRYEIILVDDHSTDKSKQIIADFAKTNPVRYFLKKGKIGKAQSLMEGFSYAKYDLVGFIDGDLQYPPEAIAEMLTKIAAGADVVVANRHESRVSLRRKVISYGFRYLFGRFLHGLNYDVQSGLKLFQKVIIQRLTLHPSPWTFDLEFLTKARNAGYLIAGVDITFSKRYSGQPKISLFKAAVQMGWQALKIKMLGNEIVPLLPKQIAKEGEGFHYRGIKYVHHTKLHHSESAFHRLSRWQVVVIILLLAIVVIGLIYHWHTAIVILLALLTVLYFLDLFFNFFLIYRSFSKDPEIKIPKEETDQLKDRDLPVYTIFCPLYREWDVLPQFVTAMSRLDYPKEKLQVMLLLEEDDTDSLKHVKNYHLPSYFELRVVPHSLPKTKPKALNYGLKFAKGEYAVVYDAEDIPEPRQLKKALIAFSKVDPKVVCIQAKLNFYNPHHNVLTRIFSAEYSLWFDLVLTGLQSISAPIPLGGTSNHFRTKDLHTLQGWDSFNVTEDCDLGMRLVKRGYLTAVIDSMTLEEANSSVKNWFFQRTRWIKGYLQTYLVHMRKPRAFFKGIKNPHLVTFQLIVGGKVLSMFINPLMWTITIVYFTLRPYVGTFIDSFFPAPVLYMAVFSLVFGNFLYMYYYMIGCAKREYDDIIKYVVLVPFYWLMMSVATWHAVYRIIRTPHYWNKTPHGLHLKHKKGSLQAKTVIGKELVDQKLTAYPIELPVGFIKKD